ncbi:rifin PIR protein, putative [Plasmodium reichenowi]|uniref:Rifin PIR protein, putative n=1 Tax=Plasmodium reichenowi TaxID=5854 RepID=A0A2P9D3Y3_PLARE|nr:rifin PIR protein, putative [Plasmodium reichenowi]
MKLHYSNILLFAFLLNISVTSYHAHNKYKTYNAPYTSGYTSRVLSECDIQLSNYDKDVEMKSVREGFDRQTSQRFQEYGERMKDKRQKRKEERDKNIQKIIEKDKMEKSLSEKVEKVCLRCGCGLGGVAASVGIFGGVGIYGWKSVALVAAARKGTAEGIAKAIAELYEKFLLKSLDGRQLTAVITAHNFKDINILGQLVQTEYYRMSDTGTIGNNSIFTSYAKLGDAEIIRTISANARTAAVNAGEEASRVEGVEIALVNASSTHLYNAIGYSVLAIFIIVLVMIIIYLVLRYRRKKKMNKKAQYTKLLNQ